MNFNKKWNVDFGKEKKNTKNYVSAFLSTHFQPNNSITVTPLQKYLHSISGKAVKQRYLYVPEHLTELKNK